MLKLLLEMFLAGAFAFGTASAYVVLTSQDPWAVFKADAAPKPISIDRNRPAGNNFMFKERR